MRGLIDAFLIFFKYIPDEKYPTHCEHDELFVACDPAKVSEEDIKKLEELGFFPNDLDGFSSYRYGSC